MNPAFFIVTAKQIQVLRGCCCNTARKELRTVKDAIGANELTIRQLAHYWQVPTQEIADTLLLRMR